MSAALPKAAKWGSKLHSNQGLVGDSRPRLLIACDARRAPIFTEATLVEYYLNDERWALIASLLPGNEVTPGRHGRDNRLFIEAVFWIVRTGSPWRSLPPHFGKWNTNYMRFRRWTQKRVWPGVLNALGADETCEYFYEDGAIQHAPRRGVAHETEAAPPTTEGDPPEARSDNGREWAPILRAG